MTTYLLFLLGIMALGDVALIPLLYFSVTDSFSLSTVILIGLIANTIMDVFWYWVGRMSNKEKIFRFFRIDRLMKKNAEIFFLTNPRADKILFISNFLYGIRVPVRVLYGMERLPLRNFLRVGVLGTIIWILIIAGLAFTLNTGAEELKIYVRRGEIVFSTFVLLIVLFEIWAKKYIKKFMSSKEQDCETNQPGTKI